VLYSLQDHKVESFNRVDAGRPLDEKAEFLVEKKG